MAAAELTGIRLAELGGSHRLRAMLAAVAADRVEMTRSAVPDMFVDGVPCSDQYAAHVLARAGLVRPTTAQGGARVPAALTEAGATTLRAAARGASAA